jgi:hypothetical protein
MVSLFRLQIKVTAFICNHRATLKIGLKRLKNSKNARLLNYAKLPNAPCGNYSVVFTCHDVNPTALTPGYD